MCLLRLLCYWICEKYRWCNINIWTLKIPWQKEQRLKEGQDFKIFFHSSICYVMYYSNFTSFVFSLLIPLVFQNGGLYFNVLKLNMPLTGKNWCQYYYYTFKELNCTFLLNWSFFSGTEKNTGHCNLGAILCWYQ